MFLSRIFKRGKVRKEVDYEFIPRIWNKKIYEVLERNLCEECGKLMDKSER